MILTKTAHQSTKFQTFDCSSEISPNLYFDSLLLLKVYKIPAKKVQWSYIYLMILKSDAKFEKNWFVVLKMTRIWWILIRAHRILKNLHFLWSLSCKVCNVWCGKKEKSTCGLENDLKNLASFHQNTFKVSKLVLFWDPFVQSTKCMS